ncbi:hypothetical protein L6452_35303 [Arctium lappa]|uniref:Uncharacterized protein n=1 Tax=Arctium lappa TaxID=4217 RepID=A0ACB8Y639_ARCLA|nr:hypothetical protein L6452_35303 [Arctium lappa]
MYIVQILFVGPSPKTKIQSGPHTESIDQNSNPPFNFSICLFDLSVRRRRSTDSKTECDCRNQCSEIRVLGALLTLQVQ